LLRAQPEWLGFFLKYGKRSNRELEYMLTEEYPLCMALTIGILAGMGPDSTAPFVDMVVRECQRQYGAKVEMDFPPMFIYTCPTPVYLGKPLEHDKVEAAIRFGLQRLANTGVAFVAMPCNTAHLYHAQLQRSIAVPLLNMVMLAVDALPARAKRPAVLAIGPTFGSGLYQDLIRQRGLLPVESDGLGDSVEEVVLAVKSGKGLERPRELWSKLLARVKREGADCAILACTDLNRARFTGDDRDLSVVDATECLAQATIRHWLARRDGKAITASPSAMR
jgi:aspartate racemase